MYSATFSAVCRDVYPSREGTAAALVDMEEEQREGIKQRAAAH